jgi:adenylate cyclase
MSLPEPDTEVPSRSAAELERENRLLTRRLRRLEANARHLEEFQDSNSTLLSHLLRDLELERARSHELLLNVLPQRIIDRLNAGETRIADRHDDVAVLFSDFVGFTRISAELDAATLIEELSNLFRGFDEVCATTGVEKIKTVGDAYLVVGGLAPDGAEAGPDPASAIAETALRMIALVAERPADNAAWQVRIGINAGPIVAGIVGTSKFVYDVWGDTVNVASRLETTSEPGRIHVSGELASRLESRYLLEPRGDIELKGKGPTETYFLVGRREATPLFSEP